MNTSQSTIVLLKLVSLSINNNLLTDKDQQGIKLKYHDLFIIHSKDFSISDWLKSQT